MTRNALVFPLFALIACSGNSKEETADTSVSEGVSFDLATDFVDGLTWAAIAGAEVCYVLPEELADTCETTDSEGSLTFTWTHAEYTNVLWRLTHDDYYNTLYTGRYDAEVHDDWTAAVAENGVVNGTFYAFTPTAASIFLSSGGLVPEDGMGSAVYWMVSRDGSALDGTTVTLENEAGESVGQVAYTNLTNTGLSTTLEATSISGGFAIASVEPGEYTLRLTHNADSDLSCGPGFAYVTEDADTFQVPAEANTVTFGSLWCAAAKK